MLRTREHIVIVEVMVEAYTSSGFAGGSLGMGAVALCRVDRRVGSVVRALLLAFDRLSSCKELIRRAAKSNVPGSRRGCKGELIHADFWRERRDIDVIGRRLSFAGRRFVRRY